MNHPCAVCVVAAALSAAVPLSARAQTVMDPSATTSLFGGSRQPSTARQQLNFLLSSTEAYDTDLPDKFASQLAPNSLQSGGYSTMLQGSGNYSLVRAGTQLRATGSSDFRYFASLDDTRVMGSSAAVGLTSRLSRNAELMLNQTAAYSPSYLHDLLAEAVTRAAGVAPSASPDYRVDEVSSYAYGSTVTVSDNSFAGGKFNATGQFDRVDFQHQEVVQRPDLRTYTLGGNYLRAFSRKTELSLGYRHRSGEFGYGGWTTEDGAVIGFNYSHPLSSTRRAEFRLTVMPETVFIPDSARYAAMKGRTLNVSADASFGYPFYRTWHASANVRRRLEYIATLSQPVFSDGGGVRLDGFLTRRTHLSLSAAYSDGASALSSRDLRFESYRADTEIRYALTRTVAVYGSYLRYYYQLRGTTAEIVQHIPARLDRTGVRAGLIVSLPVIGR